MQRHRDNAVYDARRRCGIVFGDESENSAKVGPGVIRQANVY